MPRTYRSSEQTRHTILTRAVELFNERGTDAVTTNILAEAASISPGNLYYHFPNKEAIIRAILEQMIRDWDGAYQALDLATFGPEALRGLLSEIFRLTWQYRFFYRELIALLRRDEALRARYQAIYQQRLADQNALVARLAELHGGEPGDSAGVDRALRVAWILGDSWLLHLETIGQPVEPESMQEGVELILSVLAPYLPGLNRAAR